MITKSAEMEARAVDQVVDVVGPEAVRRIGLALRQTGHRTLERVRMQVRHAGQHPATEAFTFPASCRNDAARIDRDARIARPTLRTPQRLGGMILHAFRFPGLARSMPAPHEWRNERGSARRMPCG